MKLTSWNVNGLRSAMDKGFREFVESERPDVLCLQETKAEAGQADLSWAEAMGYQTTFCNGVRKGYSGTALLTLATPQKIAFGMEQDEHDQEGRILTATFPDYHLVNVYTPNAQRDLVRLDYRMQWDIDFLKFLQRLREDRPVIFCGDLNCAHQEIDLANPKQNRRNAGFTDEERSGLTRLLEAGFKDAFRELDPASGKYTWWSYRFQARTRNIGWRLDYFMVDERLWPQVSAAPIRPEIQGSDHCPVQLVLH
jgi:exodeoxyribonuclease-3